MPELKVVQEFVPARVNNFQVSAGREVDSNDMLECCCSSYEILTDGRTLSMRLGVSKHLLVPMLELVGRISRVTVELYDPKGNVFLRHVVSGMSLLGVTFYGDYASSELLELPVRWRFDRIETSPA